MIYTKVYIFKKSLNMANPKSLYYLDCKAGTSVYNSKNDLIGVTTGYASRPNGTKESVAILRISAYDLFNINLF